MYKLKLIIGTKFLRYKHSDLSPMVINLLPMVMLQRDSKGPAEAQRPPPHLMLFLAWWCWQLRIHINL